MFYGKVAGRARRALVVAAGACALGTVTIPVSGSPLLDIEELHPYRGALSGSLGVQTLRDEDARAQSIAREGVLLGAELSADVVDVLTIAAYAGIVVTGDRASFQESVIDLSGNVSNARSSLYVGVYSLSAGLRTPNLRIALPNRNAPIALWALSRYGYAWHDGKRTISDCSDCTVKDIDLNDGTFVEGAINGGELGTSGGWLVSLAYRHYARPSSANFALTLGVGVLWF